ncbi:MAG: cupin domain-containing protein [Burkholderiales bacterium]|nr:cupin domain-containing protein [Burkholderiales bacterium]
MSESTTMSDAAARQALQADLARVYCRVHQPDDPPLFTREPNSTMVPLHWRWSELGPLLDRLGAEIAIGSGGQRRTLRLSNPGLPYGTTPTFWASIQVIQPGEVAEAHRHTASAFRFIMQGSGATTTVNGENYPMNEGDLVLTPPWAWHDHVHGGSQQMIWLDVLDISLVRSMHAVFFEPFTGATQPVDAVPDHSYRALGSGIMRPPRVGAPAPGFNPLLAYPADRALTALDLAAGLAPDPFDDVVLEYQNPVDGGPAMKVMSMKLLKLRAGFQGQARRQVGSKLYYVCKGQGTTVVAGRRFDWKAGDFFVVPPWCWHEHAMHAASGEAVLFQVDDTPAMDALGYYREQAAAAGTSLGHHKENA